MIISEIQQFPEVRYKARAYFSYLFTRNISNNMPDPSADNIIRGLEKISSEVESCEAVYLLDYKGEQLINNISRNKKYEVGKGEDRSNKSYYYRVIREKRSILTDPYPSSLTNDLSVTASYPIYDDKNNLRYIACLDISLKDVVSLGKPSKIDSLFSGFSKITYSLFAFALFLISLVLFINAIKSFILHDISMGDINLEDIFESTIILTLALAIFDLVKTIFEEEVLHHHKNETMIHKNMVRFLGSIIIALSIEALMLVFKFAINEPEKIMYTIYLISGIGILIISLSIYLWVIFKKENNI